MFYRPLNLANETVNQIECSPAISTPESQQQELRRILPNDTSSEDKFQSSLSHHKCFSPGVSPVCTPLYKKKVRDAAPFITPSTAVPPSPSSTWSRTLESTDSLYRNKPSQNQSVTALNEHSYSEFRRKAKEDSNCDEVQIGDNNNSTIETPRAIMPEMEPDRCRGKDCYFESLLEHEESLDRMSTEERRKFLDLPPELPAYLGSRVQVRKDAKSEAMSFDEFKLILLAVNGLPLKRCDDEPRSLEIYNGNCLELFDARDPEFRAAFENRYGGMDDVTQAAPWFSRNTLNQNADTQQCRWFPNHGEIPIQVPLVNHIKSAAKRREAISNCYRAWDNLNEVCDIPKYDEKRRIQNLMRRVAENLIDVYVENVLLNDDNPEVVELKMGLEEMNMDTTRLVWAIVLYPKYSSCVYGAMWDWLQLHGLLKEEESVENVTRILKNLYLTPSELNDTDLTEVVMAMGLTTSEDQLKAFSNQSNFVITRNKFVQSLSHVPFNIPDFALAEGEQESLLDMERILEVASLIAQVITDIQNPDSDSERTLNQKRVNVTYSAPGTATETQRCINLRCYDFIVQDFLGSYVISYEEIQTLIACERADMDEGPFIHCKPRFISLKMIELAVQLMIVSVTLCMGSAERFTLKNPMGPLAVRVDESAVVERSKTLNIPLPRITDSGKDDSEPLTNSDEDLSACGLIVPEKYEVEMKPLDVMQKMIECQRREAMDLLTQAPKLQEDDWRPRHFKVVSANDEEIDDNGSGDETEQAEEELDHVSGVLRQLSPTGLKVFTMLNSGECLVESAKILISSNKKFPKPVIPLDAPELFEQGKLISISLMVLDELAWSKYFSQQSILAESLTVPAGPIRWTSLLLLCRLYSNIQQHIFVKK